MFETIRSLLSNEHEDQGPPTPAAVREAIEETEEELEAARSRLSRLESGHADVLLEGTDAEIDEHEALIADTERAIQRLEVARERLEGKLEEAEEAAAERERERKYERGRELREEFFALRDRYADLVEEMVPVLEQMATINREVEQLHREVGTGPDRSCVPPARDAFPSPNSPPFAVNEIAPAGPDSPYFRKSADNLRPSPWRDTEKRRARREENKRYAQERRGVKITSEGSEEEVKGISPDGRAIASQGIGRG